MVFRSRFPKLSELMEEAEEDMLSYMRVSRPSTGIRSGPTTRSRG
jgi:hypothetical protein